MGIYLNIGNKGFQSARKGEYVGKVSEYSGDILLVGVNYDKPTKTHTCQIERWEK